MVTNISAKSKDALRLKKFQNESIKEKVLV
jgi:hypothetical protein